MTKRIISALLCICMLISAGPVGFAETAEQIVEPEETEEENLFSAEENLNSGTCGRTYLGTGCGRNSEDFRLGGHGGL